MVACCVGQPLHADFIPSDSGLAPEGLLQLIPALETLRILPFAKGHAAVMGQLYAPGTATPSWHCPRGLLQRLRDSAMQDGLRFSVGVEIEFCIVQESGSGEHPD